MNSSILYGCNNFPHYQLCFYVNFEIQFKQFLIGKKLKNALKKAYDYKSIHKHKKVRFKMHHFDSARFNVVT